MTRRVGGGGGEREGGYMFQTAWPKISQRGGVEDESERKEMVVEKKWSCKKAWGALWKGFLWRIKQKNELRRDRKKKRDKTEPMGNNI